MEMTKMIKELQEKLGEEYEIELACNEKNNGICMQGICIGRKDEKIRPTIYVRDSDSVDDVIRIYQDHSGINFTPEQILDRDYVLQNIFPVLLNSEKNKYKLEKCPHRQYADLDIAYRVRIKSDDDALMSYLLTTNYLDMLQITEQELYNAAIRNIYGKAKLIKMNDFLGLCLGNMTIMIISNENLLWGAAMILDEQAIDELKDMFGDFYVIPSSVNELLVFSKEEITDPRKLLEIIKEVNTSVLDEQDYLSDNLYVFTDRLEVV